MSEYQKILETRLRTLKTDYVTALTNIERVEKDLIEAKISSTEMLGAIKILELLLMQFSKVVEVKPAEEKKIETITEPTSQKLEVKEREPIKENKILDTRPTPRIKKRKTNREN